MLSPAGRLADEETIRELGGTMPEELPVAESIKKIETNQRKRLGKAETPSKKKGE